MAGDEGLILTVRLTVDNARLERRYRRLYNAARVRRLLVQKVVHAVKPIRDALLQRLHTAPGNPTYPIVWQSRRQKRAVLAYLRETDNLPYQRTNYIQEGWEVVSTTIPGNIPAIQIQNLRTTTNAHYEQVYAWQYVYGRLDDYTIQQTMHALTGWPKVQPLVEQAGRAMREAARSAINQVARDLREG